MAAVPHFKLNTGASMPAIGLGCWGGVTKEERAGAQPWILSALKAGYRHLDTAWIYGTEKVVGDAIRESEIPREEIFVTTKLPWHHGARVAHSIEESLSNLGLDYVDMYLLHWPQPVPYEADPEGNPVDKAGELIIAEKPTFNEVWSDVEKVYASGKARNIGVSNFSIKNLESLLETANIVPANNQVELHPYLAQPELKSYCESKRILVTAYTPTGYGTVRADPAITQLAGKYSVMPAQIILAWHAARGNAAVPKSSKVEHQKSNLEVRFGCSVGFNLRVSGVTEAQHGRYPAHHLSQQKPAALQCPGRERKGLRLDDGAAGLVNSLRRLKHT